MTFIAVALAFVVGVLLAWSLAGSRLGVAVRRADRLEADLDAERRTAGARGDLNLRQQEVAHLVAPLRETLAKVEGQLHGLETTRQSAYAVLTEQVRSLAQTHDKLRDETRGLADALRAPNVRGQWGEMQLRRVVELAGMVAHCDFTEQSTSTTPDGVLRPDMVVRLPGGRTVVIDSKVPLAAYLEAAQSADLDGRRAKLKEHARRVRAHIDALAAKGYWQRFSPSPDYVVLFVPGEAFLADALDQDPTLLEYGVEKGVVLASPTSLIMLLKAVALGWREESLAASAQEVCTLGKELYNRLSTLGSHMAGVGQHLDKAVDSYNSAVGSLEGRVLVTARRLRDLDVTDAELAAPPPVDRHTRRLQAAEYAVELIVLDDRERLPTRAELELANSA
ncbi:MAG: DNA recombination protein RmuC [Mycobacteriales bacterium]